MFHIPCLYTERPIANYISYNEVFVTHDRFFANNLKVPMCTSHSQGQAKQNPKTSMGKTHEVLRTFF